MIGRGWSGAFAALVLLPTAGTAQQRTAEVTVFDSIAVEGNQRISRQTVLSRASIPLGQPVSWRDLQRAMTGLYQSGEFRDVRFEQGAVNGRDVLIIRIEENAVLWRWDVEGVSRLPERTVKGKIRLLSGRPYNPADAAMAMAAIDSLYKDEGFYQTQVSVRPIPRENNTVFLMFDIEEGSRVAVSRVIVEGNEAFEAENVVGAMRTKPEGFFWWKNGEYDEAEVQRDVRERLPAFYARNGYIDFQVLRDTIVVNETTGKGTLILSVDEGERYDVGTFEIVGNRQFTTEQLETFFPFRRVDGSGFLGMGAASTERLPFDQSAWDDATQELNTLYFNNGYIYARIDPIISRRTASDGTQLVDLRWQILEGSPAIVNRIRIVGNTITHENVIRRAILMAPGDIFRQDAFIRSYQNVSNIGFFEQPLPVPRTEQANQQGDVDIIFEVQERRTGNVNFGASVGQGTGIGGFIGLDEPNLFGKGKRIGVQLQFGANLSDFNVSYTDPALRGSLVSGTIRLHNTRQRFTVADLGRITTRGGSVQLGFPLLRSRFTRVLGSYTLEQSDFDSPTLSPVFNCQNCVLSSTGMSIVRDTRIGLPFATGGTMHEFSISQNGGPIGGSGNFRRATFDGRWYAPLSTPSNDPTGSSLQWVLGVTAKSGFVWGDAGPHFRQLFAMGGTQFGIPLRGYDEFSITPLGFDPTASGSRASGVNAFGRTYMAATGEIGLRISQALYVSTFFDAGNVWSRPEQFNPTRMFRGAGMGVSILSPLGPIGLDYAFGFDRTDSAGNADPGWQFHFKLGNFF